jgi:pullulanase
MFTFRKNLGLIAVVCTLAGLVACGGGSGTGNKKLNLLVCNGTDVILANGSCGVAPPPPPCPAGQIRPSPELACIKSDFVAPTKPVLTSDEALQYAVIYVNKADAVKDFSGYTLYTWQGCSETWATASTKWEDESQTISSPEEADPVYGAYFKVKLKAGGTCGSFIVRGPGRSSQTADLKIQTATTGSPFDRRFFVIENSATGLVKARTSDVPICINDVCKPFEKPALAISDMSAHWVSPSTILWDRTVTNVALYAANDGTKITANLDGSVAGGTKVADLTASVITTEQTALTPHLASFKAYSINLTNDVIKGLLKKELVIVGVSDGAKIGTRIQNYGVLDALYTSGTNDANEATLGVTYKADQVTVSVWAPTAKTVELRLFSDTPTPTVDGVLGTFPSLSTKPMVFDNNTGIWSYTGSKAELDRKYYRFRVTGYNFLTNKTQILEVSDPQAVSLSTNGYHSQIVNLNDADLKPNGWDAQEVPVVLSPEAMSIYETHIRDFSINDESTPAAHRGKYLAFTDANSAPVKHLKALKAAGLTHIHLLPINDGSSINEYPGAQYSLDNLVRELCVVAPTASVCSGDLAVANRNVSLRSVLKSYAGDTDKARKLMESLGPLDGFNWNYDPQFFNAPEGSYASKADGTARVLEARAMNLALHQLGLRVVLDVVYPHMKSSGVEAADATFDKIVPGYYFRNDSVTGTVVNETGAGPETATEHAMMGKFVADSLTQWAAQYKVDGFRFDQSGFMPKSVLVNAYNAVKAVDPDNYFYAEAWTGGATSGSRIAERASQIPLAGTGIGTFNDRIRNPLRELALVNGGELNAVRAGLAGNLSEFLLLSSSGKTLKASSVGAYNLDPQEAINYVEKHDNETLWDWMHKPKALPDNTTLENRVRIQDLTLSVPLLSQGVPFFQMGSDILRSKSMSGDSYNAGDWFNFVDFTKQTNNWAVGLSPKSGVSDADLVMIFKDPESKPTPQFIQKSSDVFNEFLKIASSSPLFSLTTAVDVIDRVGFHDGGVTQKKNLIIMSIDDGAGTVAATKAARADLDPALDAILVVFNGAATEVSQKVLTSAGFTLHSLQATSVDDKVRGAKFVEGAGGGTFTVPPYTTAVFVKAQAGAQGAGLSATATSGYEPPVPYGETAIYVRGEVTTPKWDLADSTNQLVYEGNGIYSIVLKLTPGSYPFKIASKDWNTVDRGVAPADPAVTLGTPKNMQVGGADTVNATITVAQAGDYRFELNAANPTAPVLTVVNTDVFKDTSIYVRGQVTTPAWDTANATNELVHEGNSIYAVTLDLAKGSYDFKVASSDWNTVDRGVASADPIVVLGTPKTLQPGGGADTVNLKVVIETASKYRFELNARKPLAPTLKVYDQDVFKGTPIYVRGSLTTPAWDLADATNELIYVGKGIYSSNLLLSSGKYEFKIASKDWNAVDRGVAPADPVVILGQPKTMQTGGGISDAVNLKIEIFSAGTYKFELNTASAAAPVLTVKSN